METEIIIANTNAAPTYNLKVRGHYVTADGRADETLTPKLYQHYGFQSNPPIGTELATVQEENHNASVAENDGQDIAKNPGDVVLYTSADNSIKLIPNETISLTMLASGKIQVTSSGGQIVLDAGGSSLYLMTESFKTALVTWINTVVTALSALGHPAPWVPPVDGGLTKKVKAE